MNKNDRSPLTRRGFMGAASALAGYSLVVRARGATAEPGRDQIRNALDRMHTRPAPDASYRPEPGMRVVDVETDLLIAGGGMAGVCGALAAARNGARVLLVQDRSRLGGNASSEVRMHIVGADIHGHRSGWREGGILEELRLDDAVGNPHRAYELWDLLLYDKVVSEPNVTLLLDTTLFRAEVAEGRITTAWARCDKTETLYRIRAPLYADCTGDSRLAAEAGADLRWGRESAAETGEALAIPESDRLTQGSSILFMARNHGRPMPFTAPAWARRITADDLQLRRPGKESWEYGYWWIELGGDADTIRDNERLRFDLLSIVLGVWDHIKNSGAYPGSAHWALEWIGMVPGKRESRRVLGDHILTQMDLEGRWRDMPDGVCIGGWSMDDHPPGGFNAPDERPARQTRVADVYNIPLGALYSRNVENLFVAGRNLSATHVAFTSTRVMGTCAAAGQAMGTAAAHCARAGITPRQLRADPAALARLRQALLRDDQSIREVRNEDPDDLARRASAAASGEELGAAAHVLNGFVRDLPGEWNNRWGTAPGPGAWIELRWKQPVRIAQVQLTFDTGFDRQLTLTGNDSMTAKMVRGPQPETVRDYDLELFRGRDPLQTVLVRRNHQRLRRHDIDPLEVDRLRVRVLATHGAPEARLYEIRCYPTPTAV